MDEQQLKNAVAGAVASTFNDAMMIVLDEAHTWDYFAERTSNAAQRAERRHVANALRHAAAKIRRRAEETTERERILGALDRASGGPMD
jgi:hypothetical protein